MTNNDILRRLRYALNISDVDMVKIFSLGGIEITVDEVKSILKKDEDDGHRAIKNIELNRFLNGFVVFRRGPLQLAPGKEAPKEEEMSTKKNSNNNNIILRKLRIALEYKSDDMIKVLGLGDVEISESELSALFRKKDHKNYRECGDKYIRCFLKGLVVLHRGERAEKE